jgi:hypothetical protein
MQSMHMKTTSRQAKADFRKHGPRVSDAELRKIERRDELEARANRLKELEKKRKLSKRKREEKDEREQDAKRRMGIGVATQLAGFSHSQKRMKSGMETFLGKMKSNGKENVDSRGCSSVKTEGTAAPRIPLGGNNGQIDGMEESDMEDNRHKGLWDTDAQVLDDATLLEDLEPAQEDCISTPPPPRDNAHPATTERYRKREGGAIGEDDHKPRSCLASSLPSETISIDVIKVPAGKETLTTNAPTTPQTQRQPASSKHSISPTVLWDEFLASNTQITRELSQPTTPIKTSLETAAVIPLSTQDLELSPTDLQDLGGVPDSNNTKADAIDGISSCDFAYFGCTSSGGIALKRPSFPPPPSRSFSKPMKPHAHKSIFATSSKTVASEYRPSPAERSFTSKYEGYGLSTQILQDALDDTESDTEEEDFMAAIPVVERDRILMPPPPSRTSPKVFKPPSPPTNSSRYCDVGLSTQILQDVIVEEVELFDEEVNETAASSSFGAEDLGEGFWDDALEEHGNGVG